MRRVVVLADAEHMTYRAGDGFKDKASGRSNQQAVFITNLGRAYSVDIRELPSARGQGEPLSSKVNLQQGEFAEYVIIGQSNDYFLLASDKAYGFICKYEDILTRLKGGRALVSLDADAKLFAPIKLSDKSSDLLAVASSKYFDLNRRLDLLVIKSLRSRIGAFLLGEAKLAKSNTFCIRFNRVQLAEYLCCDRSALCREI